MWSNIFIIYLKEIKEVLRDRRTLIFMLVLPTVFMPVLMNIMISIMAKSEKKAQTEVLKYAVLGAENLPQLAQEFIDSNGFEKVDISSLDEAVTTIKQDTIKFALVIPQNAQEQIKNDQQVAIQIYFNNASVTSRVRTRAGNIIRKVSDQMRAEYLTALGLDSSQEQEQLVFPLVIEDHSTANKREVLGERVGGILPYLFIIFCMMGSMYPAIDLGAGEKERGTLETLLLAPIKRYQIVLGKFLVIFTTGVTAALLSITGIGVMLALKAEEIPAEMAIGEVLSSITIVDLVLIASMLIPTAAMFAAVLMSVSIYSRSFKEAYAYCGQMNFLAILPAFIAMLPIAQLNWFWAMIPITNVSLAIKELIKGTMNYEMLIAILGSSFIIASLFLLFSTKWFERESVLFRE